MNKSWPFKEAPNTGVLASQRIFSGDLICFVYRDWEDGSWQFLPNQVTRQSDAILVCLGEVHQIDSSIADLADLPPGWMAVRKPDSLVWSRHKHHPYPVFGEKGFYLDDSTEYGRLYPDKYQIPDERLRTSLKVGDQVKLIFRFADEWCPRRDNECERMWVEVLTVDEENMAYEGKLLNTPALHEGIKEGEVLWFHPLHVFDVA
jgi:hypothetical protein